MPKLPTAEDLGNRPIPQVRGGIQPLNLQTPQLGAEGRALEDFGQAVQGMGNTMLQLAANEKKKLDATRARGGVNDYLDGQLDLESGKDGFLKKQSGAAVTGNLVETYNQKTLDLRKKIRDALDNDEQRQIFDQHADIADRQYKARLYTHLSQQTQIYEGVVHDGTLLTERKMAVMNRDQPGAIRLALLNIDKAIEDDMRKKGMNFENAQDQNVIASVKMLEHTKVHSDVVDAMLASGQDKAALAYFQRIQSELTPDAIAVLGSKVQAASTDGAAMRAADEVWNTIGPRSPNEPIRLDLLDGAIRQKYADDPRVAKAAIQEIHLRASEFNDAQRELKDSNSAAVLGAYHDGKTMNELQSMPQYQALDGESKEKIRNYVLERGYSEQSHRRQEAIWAEGEKAKAGAHRYWDLSQPRVLAAMTENQIWALEPELGSELTQKLIAQRRNLDSPAKVLAATVDADLFNQAAHKAGLSPYDKNLSPDKKAQLGQLKNHIEGIIDLEQRGGRELTRTQKEEIVQKEMDRKVWLDTWSPGRYNQQIPAGAVLPKQRENIYVQIGEIDPKWVKGALNYMRSAGAVPLTASDNDLKTKYQDRLEHAYAVSITGGTEQEGRDILEGR